MLTRGLDNPRILNIHASSIPRLSRVKFVNNSVLLAVCKKTASNMVFLKINVSNTCTDRNLHAVRS